MRTGDANGQIVSKIQVMRGIVNINSCIIYRHEPVTEFHRSTLLLPTLLPLGTLLPLIILLSYYSDTYSGAQRGLTAGRGHQDTLLPRHSTLSTIVGVSTRIAAAKTGTTTKTTVLIV